MKGLECLPLCPRHYRAGREAGPHRKGNKPFHCGCCAGTCERCDGTLKADKAPKKADKAMKAANATMKQTRARNAGGLVVVISNLDEAKVKEEKADTEAQSQSETELARRHHENKRARRLRPRGTIGTLSATAISRHCDWDDWFGDCDLAGPCTVDDDDDVSEVTLSQTTLELGIGDDV